MDGWSRKEGAEETRCRREGAPNYRVEVRRNEGKGEEEKDRTPTSEKEAVQENRERHTRGARNAGGQKRHLRVDMETQKRRGKKNKQPNRGEPS